MTAQPPLTFHELRAEYDRLCSLENSPIVVTFAGWLWERHEDEKLRIADRLEEMMNKYGFQYPGQYQEMKELIAELRNGGKE